MTASAISRESGKGCESFQYRILADMNLAEEAGTGNPRRDSETASRSKVTAHPFGISEKGGLRNGTAAEPRRTVSVSIGTHKSAAWISDAELPVLCGVWGGAQTPHGRWLG
jgi:hypothetical protein